MKTSTIVAVLVVLVVALGGWYYYSQNMAANPSTAMGVNGAPNQGNMGGTNTGTPQQPATQNTVLGVSSSASLGSYLVATNGMTLYTYANDSAGKSNCTGTCAAVWPPYVVSSATGLSVPANATGIVSTTARADGSLQVTY